MAHWADRSEGHGFMTRVGLDPTGLTGAEGEPASGNHVRAPFKPMGERFVRVTLEEPNALQNVRLSRLTLLRYASHSSAYLRRACSAHRQRVSASTFFGVPASSKASFSLAPRSRFLDVRHQQAVPASGGVEERVMPPQAFFGFGGVPPHTSNLHQPQEEEGAWKCLHRFLLRKQALNAQNVYE
ncbi:hypothetical protein NDU88_007757 [Pleurodeles waltl]|uniref:Uncharacterized protein n=1 Tax=Pleurodeles waltl TaxID=8319 RepID=A0AAV7ST83_PLEWA|nr:hypothetical protein NDU88_007757 [Pleurodeles waltl]